MQLKISPKFKNPGPAAVQCSRGNVPQTQYKIMFCCLENEQKSVRTETLGRADSKQKPTEKVVKLRVLDGLFVYWNPGKDGEGI